MSEADRGPERRVVDGRFELESRLGGGGMGTVWRARDLVLHRLVAVKEVRPPDRDLAEYDPDGARMLRERVLREARALARIDHPNVVTIHHIVDGGEGTYPWLVMELVSGGSLADRLAKGPMPPAEAARVGRGVLAALRAAHDAGIQHRDVKPANVLLRPDGRPVLTDFGIAAIRETTNLTATGAIIGTPDFMAPERISGHDGGPASDLWSLAMMLYTAVEGRHPLRRATTLATLAAVLNEAVPPPERAGALGHVLMSVLVRDPSARPSAAVLDARLAEVESAPGAASTAPRDEPTSYPLSPPVVAAPQPSTGPVRVDRRPLALRSASALSLVGALALAWWLLPLGEDSGNAKAGGSPSTSATQPTVSQSSPSSPAATGSLLTPDAIRTVIKALEKESGRDRFGDFTVYSDFVTAKLMVNGSDTRYDSYTYRPGEGVKEGLDKGTLSGGDQPVSLDGFNWDRIPALLKEADQKLNVEKPEYRYVMVRQPNSLRDTPAGLLVYLTDDYGAGILETDIHGKVIDVSPAEN
ncbi:protein kinase [Streptomyces sp. NPDC046909]|uniref:serine/threonine-protein kinase n=1 Tax=Streptomyces sp. NPDC046909 TaxID=3155617 RepID=UPI0033C292C8